MKEKTKEGMREFEDAVEMASLDEEVKRDGEWCVGGRVVCMKRGSSLIPNPSRAPSQRRSCVLSEISLIVVGYVTDRLRNQV